MKIARKWKRAARKEEILLIKILEVIKENPPSVNADVLIPWRERAETLWDTADECAFCEAKDSYTGEARWTCNICAVFQATQDGCSQYAPYRYFAQAKGGCNGYTYEGVIKAISTMISLCRYIQGKRKTVPRINRRNNGFR